MTEYKLIKDLKPGLGDVDIELKVDFFGEVKRGRSGLRYCHGLLVDDNKDEIRFTVFGADVDKVKKAKRIKITKGYVKEWNGQLQLNATQEHPPEFLK